MSDEDGTRLFEGCLIALPLALALWAVLEVRNIRNIATSHGPGAWK